MTPRGYDGKGQAFINSFENLEEIFAKISKISSDKLCILEAFVHFEKEVKSTIEIDVFRFQLLLLGDSLVILLLFQL